MIARRSFLAGGLAAVASGMMVSGVSCAKAPGDRRFVFIIQRGAADGLHMIPPFGDPGYEALRGRVMASLEGAHRADGIFSFHPALAQTARLFGQGQAAVIHAVASNYRDRSHFDGQNILESGGKAPYAQKSGWLNRLLGELRAGEARAMAYGSEVPLALQGPNPVSSYAPSTLDTIDDELLRRVSGLYSGDRQLSALWQSALATQKLVGDDGEGQLAYKGEQIGKAAASLLLPADGARIMMIETEGWDTHTAQPSRLQKRFAELDAMLAALASGLGPAWSETLVLVATEFGRTAQVNGTMGTDHGTASAALLLGGAIEGGRVHADWPGLRAANLHEGRDLKPTTAMEGLISGAIGRHFGLDSDRLAAGLYPDLDKVQPVPI